MRLDGLKVTIGAQALVTAVATIVMGIATVFGWLDGRYASSARVEAVEIAAQKREASDATLRADVASLITRVTVLLDRSDRRPPGAPSAEPPPAPPPPDTEQVQRDVRDLLERLERLERECRDAKAGAGCPAPVPPSEVRR